MLNEWSMWKNTMKITVLSQAVLTHYTMRFGSFLEDIGEPYFDKNHAELDDV